MSWVAICLIVSVLNMPLAAFNVWVYLRNKRDRLSGLKVLETFPPYADGRVFVLARDGVIYRAMRGTWWRPA